MSGIYNIKGNIIGPVGNKPTATYTIGNIGNIGNIDNIDNNQLSTLVLEIDQLIKRMEIPEVKTDEHEFSLKEIKLAKEAATKSDEPTTLKHLKESGKLALDVAREIGLSAIAAIIQSGITP